MSTSAQTDLSAISEELVTRIHNLPQELEDWIKDLTISSLPAGPIVIDKHWKPPLGLQISRKTRSDFAKKYFNTGAVYYVTMNAITMFPYRTSLGDEYDVIDQWLLLLDEQHLSHIQDIQILFTGIIEQKEMYQVLGHFPSRAELEEMVEEEFETMYFYHAVCVPGRGTEAGLTWKRGVMKVEEEKFVMKMEYRESDGCRRELVYRPAAKE